MADNNTNELDALMISELPTQATANETDLFEVAIVDANSASGYASKKESGAAIADAIVGVYQYPLRITGTTAKTVSGAINEVAGEVADLKDLEGSASGDIASFVDGSDNPLKALTISIVATQSGSGDPSPTNVRPITGWTGANVYVSDEDTTNPTTYNINWQSTAGTVYGGQLNVKTGELIATKGIIKVRDITEWIRSNNNGAWDHYIFISNNITYLNLAGPPQKVMCDTFKFSTQDRSVIPDHNITKSANGKFIYIRADECESVTAFRNAYDNVDILIPYATPITYQLTPVEIRSLLGLNNVWADCGSITELKYTRDLNLCINDIISRLEALEGASSSRSVSLSTNLTKSIVSDSDANEGITKETEEETKEEAQNER